MRLTVNACPRRKFRNAHVYHINSISVNSDQETFLSADDLRINLWHLEVNDKSFSILYARWMALLVCRGVGWTSAPGRAGMGVVGYGLGLGGRKGSRKEPS